MSNVNVGTKNENKKTLTTFTILSISISIEPVKINFIVYFTTNLLINDHLILVQGKGRHRGWGKRGEQGRHLYHCCFPTQSNRVRKGLIFTVTVV